MTSRGYVYLGIRRVKMASLPPPPDMTAFDELVGPG